MYGGKLYGKGAKGYLIDIYEDEDEDGDGDYFVHGTILLIGFKEKIILNKEKLKEILNGNKYLIKIFFKEDSYSNESDKTKKLIENNIIDDYITYNDEKYFALYDIETKSYGLIKNKCSRTLDNFTITIAINDNMNNTLKQFCEVILKEIMILQINNYVHCDIKADNIMICNDQYKLIDWDLSVYTPEYTLEEICKNRYHGSATHTSPVLEDAMSTICNKKKERFFQTLKRVSSTTLKLRGISSEYNMINPTTREYLLTPNDVNLKSLYKYHIDLYSFSIVIYELINNDKKIIIENILMFINILQNTINIIDNNFTYIKNNGTVSDISFHDLLNLIPEKLVLS